MSTFLSGAIFIGVFMITSIAVDLHNLVRELRRFNDREEGKE